MKSQINLTIMMAVNLMKRMKMQTQLQKTNIKKIVIGFMGIATAEKMEPKNMIKIKWYSKYFAKKYIDYREY